MSEKKLTAGQYFQQLIGAAKNKADLLHLASTVIKLSPQEGTLVDRKLPDDLTAVKMLSATSNFNARIGKVVSPSGMLAMIMDKYSTMPKGKPEQFKKDFKEAYPEDYGQEKAKPSPSYGYTYTRMSGGYSGR